MASWPCYLLQWNPFLQHYAPFGISIWAFASSKGLFKLNLLHPKQLSLNWISLPYISWMMSSFVILQLFLYPRLQYFYTGSQYPWVDVSQWSTHVFSSSFFHWGQIMHTLSAEFLIISSGQRWTHSPFSWLYDWYHLHYGSSIEGSSGLGLSGDDSLLSWISDWAYQSACKSYRLYYWG